jgi:hypothetical protein
MRIRIMGDCMSARSLRNLLRSAGFAVTETAPAVVRTMPLFGYTIYLEEHTDGRIHLDSVDSELEQKIFRHISQLTPTPVVIDRQGGQVHSDREIRILIPCASDQDQQAVELGVLRGLLDTVGDPRAPEATLPMPKKPWWQRFTRTAAVFSLSAILIGGAATVSAQKTPEPIPLPEKAQHDIRDMQFQQDKVLIQITQLDKRRVELVQSSDAFGISIQRRALEAAREQKLDVDKYLLDLDKLVWVEKPQDKK